MDYPKDFFKNERKFNEFLVKEYLKHGSVDEVIRQLEFNLPISYAGYQRVLDRWGIVKAAGAHSTLSEAVDFLYQLAQQSISFESLYKKMPLSFRTSAVTLYRILSYVKEGITRRVATGLIITPFGNNRKILMAKDISTPRLELGKPYGALTIPMGFSRKRDPRETAILRILQQEAFSNLAIGRKTPKIIPEAPKPFMFLDIADVRVEIFDIKLSKRWSSINNFSSYKLQEFEFVDIDKLPVSKKLFRVGVSEAVEGYKKYLEIKRRNLSFNPLQYKSRLNYHLVQYPEEI